MAFEVGSRTQLLRIAETVWGTIPAIPNMTKTRFTDVSLDPIMSMIESKEIRSDRMTSDVRGTAQTGEGSIGFELCPGDYDDLIEAAMGGTWATNVLKAGATQHSFSMEVGHLGISQYRLLSGILVDKFSLSIKPQAIVTGKFDLIGQDFISSATTAATGTTAASTNSPYDAQNSSMVMKEGGVVSAIITGLDFTVDNGTQKALVVGSKNPVGAQFGR